MSETYQVRLADGRLVTKRFPVGTTDEAIRAGFALPQSPVQRLENPHANALAGKYGDLTAPPTTLGDKFTSGARNALAALGIGDRHANRWANKTFNALNDLTPVGDAVSADDARQAWNRGDYLAAGGNALLAAVGAVPGFGDAAAGTMKAMAGIGRRGPSLPANDTGDDMDTIKSLVDFLNDPRPTRQMYQRGDVLTLNGAMGEVVGENGDSLLLKLRNGETRMVSRRDPGLEVAPHGLWSGESVRGYHGTTELFDQFDPDLSNGLYFFADNPDIARIYGHRIKEADLAFKDPMVVRDVPDPARIPDLAARARAAGHDGMIIENINDVGGPQRQIVAFNPPQLRATDWR